MRFRFPASFVGSTPPDLYTIAMIVEHIDCAAAERAPCTTYISAVQLYPSAGHHQNPREKTTNYWLATLISPDMIALVVKCYSGVLIQEDEQKRQDAVCIESPHSSELQNFFASDIYGLTVADASEKRTHRIV